MTTRTIDPTSTDCQPPSGQLVLPAPPRLERSEGAAGVLVGAVPMVGGLGSILVVALLAGGDSGSTMRTRSMLAGGVFLVATLTYVVVQVDRQRRQHSRQVMAARADYLEQLRRVREQVRAASDAQRRALTWQHPSPLDLPILARHRSRWWHRAPTDSSYLAIRIGRSTQPLAVELVAPDEVTSNRADPVAIGALQRLIAVHERQRDLPFVLDLHGTSRVGVTGTPDRRRALARAMVCQAAAAHSPACLSVAVLCSPRVLAQWDWLKWLPHNASPTHQDAVGARRMVDTDPESLRHLLPRDTHVLLIVDGHAHHSPPSLATETTTIITLAAEGAAFGADGICIDLSGTARDSRIPLSLVSDPTDADDGYADQLDLASAEAFARCLAPLARSASSPGSSTHNLPTGSTLPELLGVLLADECASAVPWTARKGRERLRVPIGTDDAGAPVHLDLKESAQHGMGPHGLVIGATGSGKSELLRTLVLGLAMTHSPEQLNLVLVDFKGGATFAGLGALPHTSAVITNLASELTLVDRMQDALTGEMVRRQELLLAAGNYASARDYEQSRLSGAELDPLPSLFIVVDEFSELLSAKPEFIELFVAIGRLGRSLGLHLLLASQRLEEGRLRGLDSHLSYRIGLRTFSASESRTVLGVPDAHELPPVPGLGYLRPDPTTLTRFRAAFVSGENPGPAPHTHHDNNPQPRLWPFTVLPAEQDPAKADQLAPPPQARIQPSLLDTVVGRMSGQGPPAHRVWLPPLDQSTTLDQLMPDLASRPTLGLVSPSWRGLPGLQVPVGIVDQPRDQRRGALVMDLAGATGHVALVGGPRSGRSTALRSLVASLALTRTPREVQFFFLDFGGGSFGALAGLPHVAGSATRSEPDVVRRITAEVTGILDRRELLFASHGIDSIETYRSRRAQEQTSSSIDDGYGDIVLVIDGWQTLRADFDEVEQDVHALTARGLTFGVHLLATSSRWADFRPAMRNLLGTRLELRLGDPSESELDRRAATLVPVGRAGRGLNADGLQILVALPRIDGEEDPSSLSAGLADLTQRVTEAWDGPPAPALRLLPTRVEQGSLLARLPAAEPGLLLGVTEKQLSPLLLDADNDPHLLVLGDGGSGKSTTLRGYLREVQRTRTPRQAQLVVVDYRRSLLGEVEQEYLLNYLTSSVRAVPVLQDLAGFLRARLPGDDVTPAQLRDRSWWTGAEVHVVVDDYDLVATPSSSPVTALQPLLAQARDVGLHVVVARRSGGASRSMFDPILQSLKDLAQPGLLLAGDPEEGPLIGRLRPEAAPAGRGRLLTRDHGTQVVQVAWTEPTHG